MALPTLPTLIVSLLILVPTLYWFLGPFIIKKFCLALGWFLRRKTEGRRLQLLQIMNDQEAAYEAKNKGKATEKSSTSAGNTPKNDWDGIVGFFHPFW